MVRLGLFIVVMASLVMTQRINDQRHNARSSSISHHNVKYIEIDHELVPRKIEDINDNSPLPVPPGRNSAMEKYAVTKKSLQEIILDIENNRKNNETRNIQPSYVSRSGSRKNEDDIRQSKLKSVMGSKGEFYYDADWGLMSAVLTCYNNHWALRTGPEDWWTVVIRRIVQAMDDHGEVPQVRDFFVEHEKKKTLEVDVGVSLSNIDYNWLFSQFSERIRKNIKFPGYVDLIENDFSSSTDEQKMISNIMLMSSMKTYFEFGIYTSICGIPGVELKGTEVDWVKLVVKINSLEKLLAPINKYLHLTEWFNTTKIVFTNLLNTYRGNPDIDWWVQILSWNEVWGSGMHPYWSGWFPEFVGALSLPESYRSFPSDLVTVPLHIRDGPLADDGILVAGIVGFNVHEGARAPVVEPTHA